MKLGFFILSSNSLGAPDEPNLVLVFGVEEQNKA